MQKIDRITNKKLGEILLEEGKITKNQLEEALQVQKETNERIGEIFIKLRYVTEEDIASCIASQYGLPYFELSKYKINTNILANFTEKELQEYGFFPVDLYRKVMILAVCAPIDKEYFLEVEKRTNTNIFFVVTTASEIKEAIKKFNKYIKKEESSLS